MKYQLMVRSRMDPSQSIEAKHSEFMAELARSPSCWGFASTAVPAPDIGRHLIAPVSLKKYLQKGVRGSVNYRFRHAADDAAMYDDYLELEFDPRKSDYAALVRDAFDRFVLAFEAYLAFITDDRFTDLDFDDSRKVNKRQGVYRVQPVSYYDRELCRRAFGLTPEQVVSRLQGRVESVQVVHDGVKTVITSSVLPFEEADRETRRVTQILNAL